MRILAYADVPGRHEVYRWLVGLAGARGLSAVVLAGDLLGYANGFDTVEAAQEADARRVREDLGASSASLLYVMGNADWVELGAEGPRGHDLHGARVELGAYNFVGYRFTLPFMGGVNERTEVEIENDLRAIEPLIDSRTVLVTHAPAYGVLDMGVLDEPAGSTSLAALVARKPMRAHLHGHVHGTFGICGMRFNVACGGTKRAMLIDLDTLEHEVLTGVDETGR